MGCRMELKAHVARYSLGGTMAKSKTKTKRPDPKPKPKKKRVLGPYEIDVGLEIRRHLNLKDSQKAAEESKAQKHRRQVLGIKICPKCKREHAPPNLGYGVTITGGGTIVVKCGCGTTIDFTPNREEEK